MKRGSRVFSVLLTFVMVLALLPVGAVKTRAFVITANDWSTLSKMLEDYDQSEELIVNLTGDVTAPKPTELSVNGAIISVGSSEPLVIDGIRVTINLNGFSVDRNLDTAIKDGCVIRVINGGALTVTDNSTEKTGTICGGYTSGNGAGVYVDSGSLTLNGGKITGNISEGNGGGVYAEASTVTLNGGRVYGNYAEHGAGGGVYICDNSTLTVKKGDITQNEARYGGGVFIDGPAGWAEMSGGAIANNYALIAGGVYVWHGTFDMSGGLIVGNYFYDIDKYSDLIAANMGAGEADSVMGAVVVNSMQGSVICLSGNALIKGNEGNDLLLTSAKEDEFMFITSPYSGKAMGAAASVGVSKCLVTQPRPNDQPYLLIFDGWFGGAITAGMKGKCSEKNFFCENGYIIQTGSDGELKLVESGFGLSCDDSPKDKTLSVYVNNPPEKIVATLIAAWYDGDGKLLGTSMAFPSTDKTMLYKLTRPESANGAESYKVFLVSRYTWAPLCDACIYGHG